MAQGERGDVDAHRVGSRSCAEDVASFQIAGATLVIFGRSLSRQAITVGNFQMGFHNRFARAITMQCDQN
jgi:hypothetical protein